MGGGPHVKAFSGANGTLLDSFMAYSTTFAGGVRVASLDVNGNGKAAILVAGGRGAALPVRVLDGTSLTALDEFFAFGSGFGAGVYIGGA